MDIEDRINELVGKHIVVLGSRIDGTTHSQFTGKLWVDCGVYVVRTIPGAGFYSSVNFAANQVVEVRGNKIILGKKSYAGELDALVGKEVFVISQVLHCIGILGKYCERGYRLDMKSKGWYTTFYVDKVTRVHGNRIYLKQAENR